MSRDSASALGVLIGGRVRTERHARSWTLEQLAEQAGVSRRMLVNIEQGATNPSIATLLRISDALGVGLPALVAPPEPSLVQVTRRDDRVALWSSSSGGRAMLAAGTEPPDVVELWDWILGPGDQHRSDAHSRGTRELMLLLDGEITLEIEGQPYDLNAGDSVSFPGDLAHGYRNASDQPARFALTVFEPGVGADRTHG
ncbi:MAG: helix-turn-helix domain-containing protein [Nocardioidaceae bacterium]